jgi:hypothetical protein
VIENEEARKRKKKATSKEYRFFVWFGLVGCEQTCGDG